MFLAGKSMPSLEEIEATGKLLFLQGTTRILLLPNQDIVKYGPSVRVEEALAIKFVNQHTGLLAFAASASNMALFSTRTGIQDPKRVKRVFI